MTAYDAFALTLLAVMAVGVWACALHLSRLAEMRADQQILSWGDDA